MIFLYVIIAGYNQMQGSYRVKMPDMKMCQESVRLAKIEPKKTGAEAETIVTVFCGTDQVEVHGRKYDWFKAEAK